MAAEIITFDLEKDYGPEARRAASLINDGGLFVFPTETVYGVGARVDIPSAAARLRELKGRTDGKPFTVHIPNPGDVHRYVPELGGFARRLVERGWPGPITAVVEVADPGRAPVLQGAEPALEKEIFYNCTVGLRCPDHPVARRVLAEIEGPVAAASANLPGQAPPRSVAEIPEELAERVDVILDAGPAQLGKASTVVSVGKDSYEILRAGDYDERTIRRLTSMNFLFVCTGNTCRSPMAAGLCRQMLGKRMGCSEGELDRHNVSVRSAGVSAMSGAPPTGEAVEVMRRRGVDISKHNAARLTPELINRADRIYVMTAAHGQAVKQLDPSAERKMQPLARGEDISDPIGGSIEVYESCAAMIEKALADRLSEVEL